MNKKGKRSRIIARRILKSLPTNVLSRAGLAALTTIIFIRDLATGGGHLLFTFQIIVWLWFTVLFANFAEAVAEDTLLLDKTGTITLGNRQATEFKPMRGVSKQISPTRRNSPRLPTRRRRDARSSCSPKIDMASAAATSRTWPPTSFPSQRKAA